MIYSIESASSIAESFLSFFFYFNLFLSSPATRTYGRLSFRCVWARRNGVANFSSTCVERGARCWGKKRKDVWSRPGSFPLLARMHARTHALYLSPNLSIPLFRLLSLTLTLALFFLSYALARCHTNAENATDNDFLPIAVSFIKCRI